MRNIVGDNFLLISTKRMQYDLTYVFAHIYEHYYLNLNL